MVLDIKCIIVGGSFLEGMEIETWRKLISSVLKAGAVGRVQNHFAKPRPYFLLLSLNSHPVYYNKGSGISFLPFCELLCSILIKWCYLILQIIFIHSIPFLKVKHKFTVPKSEKYTLLYLNSFLSCFLVIYGK